MSAVIEAAKQPDSKPLVGPNVLLMGPAGTGKTFALGTLADWAEANGLRMFVLFTEQGLETLKGYWLDKDKPIPACLHWRQVLTQPMTLEAMIHGADLIGKMSYDLVTKMTDPDRGANNPFLKILTECKNLVSDRDGTKFGNMAGLGTDTIFVIDGLSQLSSAAMKMQVGAKPAAAPSDYQIAQKYIYGFLELITQGYSCTFVLIAHVSKEVNEITGSTLIGVKSAGKALAGELPQLFSDVIYTVREGDKFWWDTAQFGVDAKTRSLGYRSKIEPNFAQLMDVWKKRSGR